jgi:hypothetical protein
MGPDGQSIKVWDFHGRSVPAGEPAAPSAPAGVAGWRPESASPGLGGRFSPLPMAAPSPSQASPSSAHRRSRAESPMPVKRFKSPPFLALDREGRRIPDIVALVGATDLRGMTFMPQADLSLLDVGRADLDGADLSETHLLPQSQVALLQARGSLPAGDAVFDRGKGYEQLLPYMGPVVEWCRNYKRLMAYFWRTGKLDPRPVPGYVWEKGIADWMREQPSLRLQLQPWQKELLALIEGMADYVETGQAPPHLLRRPGDPLARSGEASPSAGDQPPSGKAGSRPATPGRVKTMDPDDQPSPNSSASRTRPRTPVKRKRAGTDDRAESPSPTKHPRTPTRPGNPPSSFTPPPSWPQARSAAAPTPLLPAPPAAAAPVAMAPAPRATRAGSARNLFAAGWNRPAPPPGQGPRDGSDGLLAPSDFQRRPSQSRPSSARVPALAPGPGLRIAGAGSGWASPGRWP